MSQPPICADARNGHCPYHGPWCSRAMQAQEAYERLTRERDDALRDVGAFSERISELTRERDEARAELAKIQGPHCPNEECPDYDSAHPFHESAVVKAYEHGQSRQRDRAERAEVERLTRERDEARAENGPNWARARQRWIERAERAEAACAGLRAALEGMGYRHALSNDIGKGWASPEQAAAMREAIAAVAVEHMNKRIALPVEVLALVENARIGDAGRGLLERVERMERALTEIADPLSALQVAAKASGRRLDGGMANALAKDGARLSAIARAALADPKPEGA